MRPIHTADLDKTRPHRNESDEPVKMWAVSRRLDRGDAVKLDGFWEVSPDAVQELPVWLVTPRAPSVASAARASA